MPLSRRLAALASRVLQGVTLSPKDEARLRASVSRAERNRPKASIPGGLRRKMEKGARG